jgi:heme exporter protein D
VELLAVAADVSEQWDGLRGDCRSLDDQLDDLLHFGPQLLKVIEIDRPSGGQHFVDCIVHCSNQIGDRAAVKGGQEGEPNLVKDLANDVVRLVLMVLDPLEELLRRAAVLREVAKRICRFDQSRRVRLEQAKEVALLRQEALKPAEHSIPCSSAKLNRALNGRLCA